MRVGSVPPELYKLTRNENTDFIIQAKKLHRIEDTSFGLLLGSTLLLIASSFLVYIFYHLIINEEFTIIVNDQPMVATLSNINPISHFVFASILTLVVGVCILLKNYLKYKKPGGYFISTPTRLIHYHNGNSRSVNWSEFSGDIIVRELGKHKEVYLKLKTGKIVKQKLENRTIDVLVPDSIAIIGVENPQEIETICRRRINENNTSVS